MKKTLFLALTAAVPAWAAELPPAIPTGPITYDEVSYSPGTAPVAEVATDATDPAAAPAEGEGTPVPEETAVAEAQPPAPDYVEPVTPAASSDPTFELCVNAYCSDYQVRGMGVCNELSRYGWSGVSASYTAPDRNLFGKGIQQRFSGTFGLIWGAGQVLGETPLFNAHYGLGKEVFPNLVVEAGYTLRHGGLEGFAARYHGGAAHRVAQDFNLSITFDDHQRGYFGHFEWGYGFQGLTGHYLDLEAGYRFTDILSTDKFGADLEVSAGVAPSFGYWGGGVEGVDACRLKVALAPFTHDGKWGRDGAWQLRPWVQCSWAGDNARKMERAYGYAPVDHFQLTVGVDLIYRF